MRINQFIAQATGMSRRAADLAISARRVRVNGEIASLGAEASTSDDVTLDGIRLIRQASQTIILNKPVGYVCSRDGQGSKTIYDLLPQELHSLKPIGRLDKDSSGLLLLTNDGKLANELTHPRYKKTKVYEVRLDKPLAKKDKQHIEQGVKLEDGLSVLELKEKSNDLIVTMTEGRNRQIRRTFEAVGYRVVKLRRTHFGPYSLGELTEGDILLTS